MAIANDNSFLVSSNCLRVVSYNLLPSKYEEELQGYENLKKSAVFTQNYKFVALELPGSNRILWIMKESPSIIGVLQNEQHSFGRLFNLCNTWQSHISKDSILCNNTNVALSKDRKTIAICENNKHLKLWTLKDSANTMAIKWGTLEITSFVFAHSSKYLIVGVENNSLRLIFKKK